MVVTSQEWLTRLTSKLYAQRAGFARFDAYYKGDQGVRLVNKAKYPPSFTRIFERYCENFMAVVVDAVEERLDIEGFRFPKGPVGTEVEEGKTATVTDEPDEDAVDPDAWRIWQANELDATSQEGHVEALVKSLAFVLVSPMAGDMIDGSPRITVERPDDVVIECEPGTGRRIVGMKQWDDRDAKRTYATLYFPDRIEKWEAVRDGETAWTVPVGAALVASDDPWHAGGGGTERSIATDGATAGNLAWRPRLVSGEDWPLTHELGVVPIVPLINRPRLDGTGESELAKVMTLQDAINTLAMNELVTSEAAAIPQKWATGIEIPVDQETGASIEPFKPDVDRIISTAAPDAKFGQFEAAQLGQFGDAIDRRVRRIASITRTPYHYFLDHGGQPPSGESLKSSETGLVRKAGRKTRHFGERWEEVMRLAFAVLRDPRANVTAAETKWAPVETMTESEHIDALIKKRGLKVPLEQLWEDAPYTPTQRARFPGMLQAEAQWLKGTLVEPIAPDNANVQDQVQERVSP